MYGDEKTNRSAGKRIVSCLLFLVLAFSPVFSGIGAAAPSETLVSATVDVIVAIDTTGSMSGWIQQVRSETTSFANQLEAEGFDYRLGLLDFKDIRVDGGPWWYGFTDDSSTFNRWVGGLRATGGGDWPESDINAMYNGYLKFKSESRSTAGRMIILITDAPFLSNESGYDVKEIGKLLSDNNIVLNIIGTGADSYGQARELDGYTRGEYFRTNDLRTAYQGIIAQIQRNTPPKVENSKVVLPPGVDPGSINTTTELEFSLVGSDADGDALRYYWEALSPEERKVFLGSTPMIRVRLTEPGVWEVTGTATDPTGESVSVTHTIAVGNRKPAVTNLRVDSANTKMPTVSWNYSDPEGHPQEKIHMRVKKSGTVVWDSGEISQPNASMTAKGMDYGQDYVVEVRAMDRYDAWSDWASLPIHIYSLPDLRPMALVTTPAGSVLDQNTVNVAVLLKNEGEQAASAFRVTLYDDGNAVAEQTISSLAGGGSRDVSFSFQANRPALHQLKAVVDSAKQVAEANEGNNEIAGSIQVLHRVELVPSIEVVPAPEVPQGGRYDVRVQIKNNGQGAAGSFRVDLFQNGARISQKTIDRLDAGAVASFELDDVLAEPAGNVTYKVIADAAAQIAESREDNNAAEAAIRVASVQEVRNVRITATPDGRSATVSWDDPADAFFDHVNLLFEGTSQRVDKGVQKWMFRGLKPETSYNLRIATVNTAGKRSVGINQTVTTPRDSVPPDDVGNARITVVPTGKAFQVTWQDPAADDVKEVRIAYRPSGETFGEPLIVPKGVKKIALDGLANGTTYEIRLTAVDIYGNTSAGITVTGVPKDTVPAGEVRNVRLTSGPQGRSIRAEWTDPNDPDYRLTVVSLLDKYGKFVGTPITVEKGKQNVTFLKVMPGADYVLQFVTVDEAGNRSAGVKTSLRTDEDTVPTEAVRNLSAVPDKKTGSIRMSWTDPEEEDLKEIVLWIKEDQEGAEWTETGRIPAGVESVVLRPEANRKYVVKAVAVDDQGNRSKPSEVRSVLLLPKPLKPADFRFNKWGTSQVIQWREEGNVSPVTYRLYRQIADDGEWKLLAELPAGTTRYVDRLELEDGERVQYVVASVDPEGTESDKAGPVGPVVSLSDNPILRLSHVSPEEVKLASTAVRGAESYTLERRLSDDWTVIETKRGTEDAAEWLDRDIRPGQRYQYRVTAERNAVRAVSIPIFVTVPGSAPSMPVALEAKQEENGVRLRWQPPAEGADAYNLYVQAGDGPILLLAPRIDALTYKDGTVRSDGTYIYHVSAWKDGKESEKAAFPAVSIMNRPPSGWGSPEDDPKDHIGDYVVVEQVGESVRISWKAAEGSPAHYFVYRQEAGSMYQKLIAVLTGDRLQFTDSTAKVGKTYVYAVQAQYRKPYGSLLTPKFEAKPIKVVPEDGILPSAVFDPSHVTASIDDGRVLITWETPKAAKEYLIYRKKTTDPMRILVGRVPGAKGTLFTDDSVKSGEQVEYEVIARYPGGNSATVKSNAIAIP
ncbi:CARDB domain-containing protein [Paenibacillus chartarius]|uniref:CARDB domain-containing protein n=1 Tax=Paenibacillus chartarius TaxID=747481 RepID=A0ABV6DMG6_9BACL